MEATKTMQETQAPETVEAPQSVQSAETTEAQEAPKTTETSENPKASETPEDASLVQTEETAPEPLPEVRAVTGYCPKDKMITIKDYSGKDSLYLEVKYRKEWFLRWCAEHGCEGVLDDSDVRYNPESRLVEGKATVVVNGRVIGKSSACKPYDVSRDMCSPTVFQDVGTIALGRALANAGFGTVNGVLDDGDTRTLSDAPVAIPQREQERQNLAPASANPMMQMMAAPQSAPPQGRRPNAARPTQQQAAPTNGSAPKAKRASDIAPASSVQEALAAIMPIGANKGKPLGEIYKAQKAAIVFFANRDKRPFDKPGFENLTKACQMILDANIQAS